MYKSENFEIVGSKTAVEGIVRLSADKNITWLVACDYKRVIEITAPAKLNHVANLRLGSPNLTAKRPRAVVDVGIIPPPVR